MRRGFLIGAGALLIISGALLATWPSRALRDFQRAADDLVARSESIRERASTFDPDAALKALGPSRWNGEYFRLDEHLDSARIEAGREQEAPAVSVEAAFDFNGGPDEPCRAEGDAVIENGILKMEFAPGDRVICVSPYGIQSDSVGSIRFRLKAREAIPFDLAWNKSNFTTWDFKRGIDLATLHTIPDGEFHVFEIDAETAVRSRLPPRSLLRTFRLRFPAGSRGGIELDYIHILPRRYPAAADTTYFAPIPSEHFTFLGPHNPAGVPASRLPELRQAIYTQTGVELEYQVAVPRDAPRLRFGMAILEDDPVLFSVTVTDREETRSVYSNDVSKLDRWVDTEVDLGPWAGRRIGLRLNAEGRRGNVAFWSNPLVSGRRSAPFNVLLVLEDSERADHLSLYGYERLTTPVKDEFAARGVVFDRALAQAPTTRTSCPSLMTSLYPSATGVAVGETLASPYVTLAEVMRSQGFTTASFVENSNAGPAAGLHQGFGQLSHIVWGTVESYGEPLLEWLREHRESNFFAYVHVMDPHGIYDPPVEFREWYEELPPGGTSVPKEEVFHDPEWVKTPTLQGRRALYDGEIRANDHYFERVLDELRKLELLDDTLVVFLADHGEHLGERREWGHHDPGYVQVLHVPLFMVYPRRLAPGTRVAEPVQLVDVMPTILEIAGIDGRGLLLQGRPLLSLAEGRESRPRLALSEEVTNFYGEEGPEVWASVFFGDRHVLRTSSLGSTVVFDLDAGPREAEAGGVLAPGLAESSERLMRKMKETNVAIRLALMRGEAQHIQTSTEDQERLRALGYIQ
jgi:hypothetical protein